MMFFKKTERKKHSVCAILTVGALATVGAISITRCGKQMMREMGCKIKKFFGKAEDCMCPSESEK